MELGSLFNDQPWDAKRVPIAFLSGTITRVRWKQITSRSAKRMLAMKYEGDGRSVKEMVLQEDLAFKPMSRAEYLALAQTLLDEKPDMVTDIVEKKQERKIKWFVGQIISRSPDGRVEPNTAEETLKELLGLSEQSW